MVLSKESINEFIQIYNISEKEVLEYLKEITICMEERGLTNPTEEDYDICLNQACNDDKLYRKIDKEIIKKTIADKAVASYLAHGMQQPDMTYRDLYMLKNILGNKKKDEQPTDEQPNITK